MQDSAALLGWGTEQSHILTGGGLLQHHSTLGSDFTDGCLPHHHLSRGSSREAFRAWLEADLRSTLIVGAWSRPLFAGGWSESTAEDTEAFNLQTPSVFVDIRVPLRRPTTRFREVYRNHSELSDEDLRVLARQHCFAGYSLPDPAPAVNNEAQRFTRHHVIDWNYLPSRPRTHPNRWFVQLKPDGTSFKEFSTVRDAQGVPVYMERWARREPQQDQTRFLALRRAAAGGAMSRDRDSVLVVVGRHFALAVDRDYSSLCALLEAPGASSCSGGGPLAVDWLLAGGPDQGGGSRRRAAEEYLSLEGSYGVLSLDHPFQSPLLYKWNIGRSTVPWLEGTDLLEHSVIRADFDSNESLRSLTWQYRSGNNNNKGGPEEQFRIRCTVRHWSATLTALPRRFLRMDRKKTTAATGGSSNPPGGGAGGSSKKPPPRVVTAVNRIKIISMGSGGSGKSCLIKRYCEDRFVNKYIATIGVDYGVKPVQIEGNDVRVNFWDLSGHPELFEIRNEFYRDAQGCLLVYDVTSRDSFSECDAWLAEAAKYGANPSEMPITLCANKLDKKQRAVSEEEGVAFAQSRGLRYFELSAQSGLNVAEMFDFLFTAVYKKTAN